jgi:WhiB family redox-sensing transcriptional regulator
MEWRNEAACAGLPWDYRKWFFGEGENLPVHEQHERARMVCYLCPVQLDCLQYWMDTDGEFGIWGGLTVSQRKRYLLPVLRKAASSEEAMLEVIWNVGLRLFPKIEAGFQRMGLKVPSLPVTAKVPNAVLVEILSMGEAEAA